MIVKTSIQSFKLHINVLNERMGVKNNIDICKPHINIYNVQDDRLNDHLHFSVHTMQ